ncbi:hypothetical protein C2G38_2176594 [Gigaspora rosea]|uniref:Uncharacterized protein n=1 Tax=Gigaspora rosea TaxID=44941 RepID=A0A397VHZ6_9GLOM|nr:hypothetical protein C2G38_2176594 [Gigaspora rosea]
MVFIGIAMVKWKRLEKENNILELEKEPQDSEDTEEPEDIQENETVIDLQSALDNVDRWQ